MRISVLFVAVGLALSACGKSKAKAPAGGDAAVAKAPATPIADQYREVAARILDKARPDRAAFEHLRFLADEIGHRLSGSKALDQAIAWAAQVMKDDGHDVRTEKVMVPHWVRGAESAKMTAPVERELRVIGLGGTIATPAGGITAPVVVVTDWKDLEAKKDQVAGKIVLYDVAMPPWTEKGGTGYGDAVGYRWAGAREAAKLGAVAVLIRSVTARSLASPHTGSMGYRDDVAKIPAAAITIEDAALIHRLIDAGKPVEVNLVTSGQDLPEVESANVIGELRGRELPDEIVVIGGHIDSWDVGTGAHDDGAGCVAVMQALTTLRQLGLTPRRTIRVVLFTNEENGLRGAKGYAEAHKDEIGKHVMALEMDTGAFAPWGFDVDDGFEEEAERAKEGGVRQRRMVARVADIASLLAPIGATRAEPGHGGADITPLARGGVPAIGLKMDDRTYFDYHHTEADTLDKVDPAMLADDIAAIAVFAYVVADMPERLDAPLPGEAAPP